MHWRFNNVTGRAITEEVNVRAMVGGMLGWMVDVFDLTLVLFIASVLGIYFFPPTNLIARLLFVFASYSLTCLPGLWVVLYLVTWPIGLVGGSP